MLIRCRPSSSSLASSSKNVIGAVRYYALPPDRETIGDDRTSQIKKTLYPPGAPSTSTPTGVHHPQHLERLAHVVPSTEAHETITRAWALHQREVRQAREKALRLQFGAMQSAMEALEALGDKRLLDMATSRKDMDEDLAGLKGREKKWKEARIEGLFPREAWVPTETPSTKGWNYEWKRPQKGE